MSRVQAEVESHYRSGLVERIRGQGGVLQQGGTVIRLAKQFGFCYGVERAIDLAYAARKVFPDRRISLLGEIIHNPEVNAQLAAMGIRYLAAHPGDAQIQELGAEDVVIVPAFGAKVSTVDAIKMRGCQIVDTTCGDVMSVWKRVRQNASEQVTSIIHGKSAHEETMATASRALGRDGKGHYLVVLDLDQTDIVCDYIRHGGDKAGFLARFKDAHSPSFDPDINLQRVGVANQTTMLRSETEEIQRRIRAAIAARDGHTANFRFFDTICGATQERQDALFSCWTNRSIFLSSLEDTIVPTRRTSRKSAKRSSRPGSSGIPAAWFRRMKSATLTSIKKEEVTSTDWLPSKTPLSVGITAGASCPNNLIEETIHRVLALRNEPRIEGA